MPIEVNNQLKPWLLVGQSYFILQGNAASHPLLADGSRNGVSLFKA